MSNAIIETSLGFESLQATNEISLPQMEEKASSWSRLGRGVLVASTIIAGGVIGAGVAVERPTPMHVGGSDATVSIKASESHVINTGNDAVLAVKIPSKVRPLGIPIGTHITIKNFGIGLTAEANGKSSKEEATAYTQLFSDPEKDISNIQSALELRAVEGACAGAASTGLILLGAPYFRRRREQKYPELHALLQKEVMQDRRRHRQQAIVIGAVVVFLTGSTFKITSAQEQTLRPDPIFAGTHLEGAELDGALAPLVRMAAPIIEKNYNETNTYYNDVRNNLMTAYRQKFGISTPRVLGSNYSNILSESDRHCNIGMNRVIGAAANLFNTSLVLDAGDGAFSGTYSFESACDTSLADTLKRKIIVKSPGNHDSPLINAVDTKAGIRVLLGQPITVDGITILGSPDPRSSRFGHPIVPFSPADQQRVIREQGDVLANSACSSRDKGRPINIVMAHDPEATAVALHAGCGIGIGISGHTHTKVDAKVYKNPDNGSLYCKLTEGSTGGAGVNETGGITVAGPLLDVATLTVLRYDNNAHKVVGYEDITAFPDKSVTISPYIALTSAA